MADYPQGAGTLVGIHNKKTLIAPADMCGAKSGGGTAVEHFYKGRVGIKFPIDFHDFFAGDPGIEPSVEG